ncbi:hypothetical protein ISCGN_028756 [Ixodes scapularis]|uniref:Cytochrome c oxidase assembly protein COX16 homolog, mitochondrial n=3 Tax=Ixodes TaxID=6944 RepID=B7P5Y1_IXOSC|nr:conserved hypothetical protein [Ixodes scapularis]|eukprot:XP_002408093.1 conserved hypothetical protein [Ixodes scapularis]
MAAVYLKSLFESVYRRRFFRLGVPFMIFVVGGSFGLKHFTSLRYEFRATKITQEDAEKEGIKMKAPGEVTTESVYEKIQEIDIDNWQNVRGPRPWEEGNEYNKLLEERQKNKST